MTSTLPATDLNALMIMSPVDISKTTAQMTALLSEMASEKGHIDSMVNMLEKQPWYKKCINTVFGKNKATVKEIAEHKDKLASYTSSALAQLYENNKIEQQQMIFLGEAINSVNGQLTATNYELLKTQAAVADLKKELIQSITGLANALNEKITSVDNFHMLITEIERGIYEYNNVIATLFSVIAQIDRRMASDDRKMNILQSTLKDKGYLNDEEITLSDYMSMIAELPEKVAGTVYYEFYCLNGNDYADMFTSLIDSYTFLPKLEKKAKKPDSIITNILQSHDVDPDTTFSTNELYDYFLDSKKDYLASIQEFKNVEGDSVLKQDNSNSVDEKREDDHITVNETKEIDSKVKDRSQSKNDVNNIDLYDERKDVDESDDPSAMFELGKKYYEGTDEVDVDYDKAFKLLFKASALGNSSADYYLALCYYNGFGATKDFTKALELFFKAAETGIGGAMVTLGNFYYHGEGVEQSYSKAVEWYKRGSEVGNRKSMYNLGMCYYYGTGLERDFGSAVKWLKKSAESLDTSAMNSLGACYYNGDGVKQNYTMARMWYAKASDLGNVDAMVRLGDMYYQGCGGKKDKKHAKTLYQKAADKGNELAAQRLKQWFIF